MSLSEYLENKPTILSEHLILRPFLESDLPDLKSWLSDESIYTYWGNAPTKYDMQPELMFADNCAEEKSSNGEMQLGIALKETNKIIGDIWIYSIVDNRMAEIGVRLSKEYRGHEYGAESIKALTRFLFENTEIKRLETKIDIRNIPSCKIIEKAGYTREGLIHQGKMVDVWCDYFIYGKLAEK